VKHTKNLKKGSKNKHPARGALKKHKVAHDKHKSHHKPHRDNGPRFHASSKNPKTKPGAPLTGTLLVSARGFGNVRIPGWKETVSVDPNDLNTGLHGDMVEITLNADNKRYSTARVTRVLSRSKVGFTGVLTQADGVYQLKADDPRMYRDIVIPKDKLHGARSGEKVFVEIKEWKDAKAEPIGTVSKILGKPGNNNAEMIGIALERGFPSDFPKDVEEEAHALQKKGITENEIAGRRDMRQVPTCTIDPIDAKDFDDALSLHVLPNGHYEIGIHIADVSHYVRPGTALDREAFARGTSVYLVDRTIPMLPEALSNDLCSLKPNVDRLAMSTIVTMTPDAKITDVWYGKTVIHSQKRFSYEEAQLVLDTGEGPMLNELTILNTLAKKLLTMRIHHGTLILDTDEVKFKLDEHGVPLEAYRKVRGDTHKLIEEFMLLANRKVAEVFKKEEKRDGIGVYRIHDLPDADKIADFTFLIENLGYSMPKGTMKPKMFDQLLKELAHAPEKDMITSVLIRSMAKAIYSTKNIGHFGLGFEDYTHFTSPIRRYPDLVVHRLLQNILTHKPIRSKDQKHFEQMMVHSSERERNAAEAERASIKYKQVEYMQTRIGAEYIGVITGLTERGLFVEELETKSEGMVAIKELGSDFFTLAERDLALIGKKTKRRFRVGDQIKIRVLRADLADKAIDYGLVE
jgi:ribonuclease R